MSKRQASSKIFAINRCSRGGPGACALGVAPDVDVSKDISKDICLQINKLKYHVDVETFARTQITLFRHLIPGFPHILPSIFRGKKIEISGNLGEKKTPLRDISDRNFASLRMCGNTRYLAQHSSAC